MSSPARIAYHALCVVIGIAALTTAVGLVVFLATLPLEAALTLVFIGVAWLIGKGYLGPYPGADA